MEGKLKIPPTVEYVGAKKGSVDCGLIEHFLKGCVFGAFLAIVIFMVFGV